MSFERQSEFMNAHKVFLQGCTAAIVAFVAEMLLFLYLFKNDPNVYWPKMMKAPPNKRPFSRPTGFIGWIKPIFTSEDVVLQRCGFDAYLFIRFKKMAIRITSFLALVVSPILIVTNSMVSQHTHQLGIYRYSMANMSLMMAPLVWIHVGLMLVVLVVACLMIRKEQVNYVKVRLAIQKTSEYRIKPSSRTVLVRHIPSYQLSQMAITSVFCKMNGGLKSINFATDQSEMQGLMTERDHWLTRLEDGSMMLIERAQRAQQEEFPGIEAEEWDRLGKMLAQGVGTWVYDEQSDEGSEQDSSAGSVVHYTISEDAESEQISIDNGLLDGAPTIPEQTVIRGGAFDGAALERTVTRHTVRSTNDTPLLPSGQAFAHHLSRGPNVKSSEQTSIPHTRFVDRSSERPVSNHTVRDVPSIPFDDSLSAQTVIHHTACDLTDDPIDTTDQDRDAKTFIFMLIERAQRARQGRLEETEVDDWNHWGRSLAWKMGIPIDPFPEQPSTCHTTDDDDPIDTTEQDRDAETFKCMLKDRARRARQTGLKGREADDWNDWGRRLARSMGIVVDVPPNRLANEHEIEEQHGQHVPPPSAPQPQELWKKYMSKREYWDEIDHPRRELARANDRIMKASGKMSTSPLTSCFVTFNTVEDAYRACKMQLPETMGRATVEMAIHPLDVRWSELSRPSIGFSVVPHRIRLPLQGLLTILTLATLINLVNRLSEQFIKGPIELILRVPSYLWGIFMHLVMALSVQITNIVWGWLAEYKAIGEPNPASRARIACRVQSLALLWSVLGALTITSLPFYIPFIIMHETRFDQAYLKKILAAIYHTGNGSIFSQFMVILQSTAGNFLRPRSLLENLFPELNTRPRDVYLGNTVLATIDWPTTYNPISSLLVVGLFFGATCPLILPVIWLGTAMASMSLKYGVLYIEIVEYETNGLFFRRALDHLFAGLYGMQIGLSFALFVMRSNTHCMVAAILLNVTIVLTAVFQMWSWRSLDFTRTNSQVTMEDNPNNLTAVDSDIPGLLTLEDLSPSEQDILITNAYKHPGSKVRQTMAWIPRDHSGVSDDEILIAGTDTYKKFRWDTRGVRRKIQFVRITNDGAGVGHSGVAVIAETPPDRSEYDEVEI